MKRLDKKRIIACPGMDVLVMGELHFMEEISDDHSKKSEFLMKLECAFQDKAYVYLVQSLMEGGDALHLQVGVGWPNPSLLEFFRSSSKVLSGGGPADFV